MIAGLPIAQQCDLLHRELPDPAQLDREPDDLDVERNAAHIAQPDQDRRDRAHQGDGTLTENTVRVIRGLLAELAREQFAERVGIADGEGIEGVAVLHAGCDHEVQHTHIVLAPEAPRERQHFAEERAVRLTIDEDEADPWASALVSRLKIAVVLPAPVVPGMVMCCRRSSGVIHSSWPVMLQPMKKLPFARRGLRVPGIGLPWSLRLRRPGQAQRQARRACHHPERIERRQRAPSH